MVSTDALPSMSPGFMEKLRQSPEAMQAIIALQQAMQEKGISPDQLTKPSIKLFQTFMDPAIQEKIQNVSKAFKEAGITEEEMKEMSKSFGASGLMKSFFK
jgi:hypothetical protein